MRREKDGFFRSHPQSPLSPAQQAQFDGLTYFDFNPALDLTITVERFADDDWITVETTTDDLRRYRRYGRFSFDVDGQTAQLTIYETPHGFFLPFVDAGANRDTYGAGRYIDLEPLDENTFHVDFNGAYNPFCVYSPAYSCPLTPFENRLSVAIRAGEKIPTGDWVNIP
ncbi:MAG: DUF1684 domain-containing protein [bacterium]|nr:DUF1684 domain-containing protein [bacterium]